MLFYPQLNSGSVTQYPVEKRLLAGAIVNELSEGRQVKYADAALDRVSWRLQHRALRGEETERLTNLFHATEGRLHTFTFHDPTANLLRWSEAFGEAVWERNTLLSVTPGSGDPLGSDRAWTLHNSGIAPLAVAQRITGLAWHTYAFSVWIRSATPGAVSLSLRTSDAVHSDTRRIGPVWKRVLLSDGLPSGEPWIEFGVELAAGQTVEVFGAQVESQRAPSLYRPTASRSGVHTSARFAEDSLRIVADGPDRYSCEVAIEALLS